MSTLEFEITAEELKKMRDRDEAVLLLDVREPWEFATAAIAGSTLIPMKEVSLRTGELDRDKRMVVVCHAGVRSAQVTAWLRQNGYPQAQSLRGGIDAWSRTIDPRVPLY